MNYTKVEQVLLDDGFYAWYLHTDEQQVAKWNEWRTAAEANRILPDESVRVLRTLVSLQDEDGFPLRIHAVHSRLSRAIEEEKEKKRKEAIPTNRAAIHDMESLDYNLA